MAGSGKACFLLNCEDRSLLENDVKHGDLIAICRVSSLNEGDTVLAMYESHVLLRRFHKNEKSNMINFITDNSLIDKEIFNRAEVTIIGKMVGKYTKY
jgi:repressor LexA